MVTSDSNGMLYMPQSLKCCIKCGKWKLASKLNFYFVKGYIRTSCKECENAACREYHSKNKTKLNAERVERGRKNREHKNEYQRRYYQMRPDFRERVKKYAREVYYKDPQANKARRSKWIKNNPARLKVLVARYDHKRRTEFIKGNGRHTNDDIQHQYNVQQGKCRYCGCELGGKYHVDHFVPLSKGGSNWPENIVIACPTCNLRKATKMPDEFLALIEKENKG